MNSNLASLAQQNAPVDSRAVMRSVAFLMALLSQLPAAEQALQPKQDQEDEGGFNFQGQEAVSDSSLIQFFTNSQESPLDQVKDTFQQYEEHPLQDGRSLRRYESGDVRLYSANGQVIQEERGNGNLLISLPEGRMLFQDHPGEPLLVLANQNGTPTPVGQARVVQVYRGEEAPVLNYVFVHDNMAHLVEVESLRYFRLKLPAMGPSQPQPAAPQSTPMNNGAVQQYAWTSWSHLMGERPAAGPNPLFWRAMRPLAGSRGPARKGWIYGQQYAMR